jgi:Tol biopolymer transport system component
MLNKFAIHWQFSLDSENNLYFGGDLRGVEGTGGIYCSKFVKGKYQQPKLIFSNKEYGEAVFGPAISPDNTYLLFARVHPRGSSNPRIFSIYISFRKDDNGWTKPLELGEKLNMDGNQPRISPDGRYIFFIRNDGQAYWVDAKIITVLDRKN